MCIISLETLCVKEPSLAYSERRVKEFVTVYRVLGNIERKARDE